MDRPSLNDLAAVMAVATHRSFRQAADTLGVAPSTLSHAIRNLEARLGVRLFHRTTRSVSLTEAGTELVNRMEPVMEGVDAALQAVASFREGVTGTVRINAHRLAARLLLEDVVPRLRAEHPGIVVDLVTEGRLVDIVDAGFDAGVRLAESVPRDMIAVPLGGTRHFVCVAAPAYLAANGIPQHPEDLKQHLGIRHRLPSGKLYHWEFEREGTALSVNVPGNVILDDQELMLDAALTGQGIAYVIDLIAQPYLQAGRLQEVLEDWSAPLEGLRLYYSDRRRVPPALRALIEAVKAYAG